MRNKIVLYVMAIVITGLSLSTSLTSTSVLAATEEPKLQIAIISDTHVEDGNQLVNNKVRIALEDLKEAAPRYSVLAVNGDMTQYGLQTEYDLFKGLLYRYKLPTAKEFMVMGNHEMFEHRVDPATNITDQELQRRFTSTFNVPKIYYDKWINGYHFITIAGEKSEATMMKEYEDPTDGDSAYISEEQFQWLKETLPVNADRSKPIFVFLHQPITNTVDGSLWGAGLEDQKILSLLKQYPQVILFSGHSHYSLKNNNSMLNDGITMVNTSSVAYTWSFEGGENYNESEGIVVDVYIDRVDIKARDFLAKSWVKTFSVPLPVKNGWIYSDGSWYFYSYNTKLTSWNMWNQNWYYLDTDGKMKTGWLYDQNKWYYLDLSGAMKTKWIYDHGQWYYLNPNGDMKTGWHYENGYWYYLKSDGAMVTGNYNVGITPYRFHADGTWISE